MSKMTKEEFVKKMMANEEFKKAEKRRQLILQKKRQYYDYFDFSMDCMSKGKKKSNRRS